MWTYAKSSPDNPEKCIGCWAFDERFKICELGGAIGGITWVEFTNKFLPALKKTDENPMPKDCPNGFEKYDEVQLKIITIIT